MKLKSLCLAVALSGLASHAAFAADGTLKFIGKVVDSSCTLTSGNGGTITVNMGSIPKNVLGKDISGPEVGVRINMQNCDPGTYYLVMDGASETQAKDDNILALDGKGESTTAQGVGIKLTDRENNPVVLDKPFDPAVDAKVVVAEGSDTASFYLKASYYGFTDSIQSGEANATARFTIIQN